MSNPSIAKNLESMPDHWVHLQKTMIPDTPTGRYWSVWYDIDVIEGDLAFGVKSQGTAWLMCCNLLQNPSLNDNWYHCEDLDESCRNVLFAIESVYGVSFHESVWIEIPAMSTEDKVVMDSYAIGETTAVKKK